MTVGVGVEGPSDRDFWDKVLHKHFPVVRFDVRNMKNKERLISQSIALLEQFRSLQYTAGFVILDRDKDPCTSAVLKRFDDAVIYEAKQPLNNRYFFICTAIRGLEAWFLADPFAVNELLPKANYSAPGETAELSPKSVLTKLWRTQFGPSASPNKIGFARLMALKFDPNIARRNSKSFNYFWTLINKTAGSTD
jgi:hypothetical protein